MSFIYYDLGLYTKQVEESELKRYKRQIKELVSVI